MSPIIPVIIAGITVIGSIGGAWISSAAATNKEMSQTKLTQQETDSRQDSSISLIKQSSCIQNSNIANISMALKVSFVPDPSCK